MVHYMCWVRYIAIPEGRGMSGTQKYFQRFFCWFFFFPLGSQQQLPPSRNILERKRKEIYCHLKSLPYWSHYKKPYTSSLPFCPCWADFVIKLHNLMGKYMTWTHECSNLIPFTVNTSVLYFQYIENFNCQLLPLLTLAHSLCDILWAPWTI